MRFMEKHSPLKDETASGKGDKISECFQGNFEEQLYATGQQLC